MTRAALVRATASPRWPAERRRPARPQPRRLVPLIGLEALTLAVFATLHLSGGLQIGAGSSDGAGIAEALICLALAAGASGLAHSPERGRRVARAALAFAIAGCVVGLTITIDGGDAIDLVYHVTMLPILVATSVLLAPRPRPSVQNAQEST